MCARGGVCVPLPWTEGMALNHSFPPRVSGELFSELSSEPWLPIPRTG
jgi:hypothetical protein